MKERQFKGLWIPVEVLTTPNLSPADKLLWADIDSFTGNGSTWFKSRETVAEEWCVSPRTVSRSLKNLVDAGLIELASNDGRTRHYVSTVPRQIDQSELPNVASQSGQIDHIENRVEKQVRKQHRFIAPSVDEVKAYFLEIGGVGHDRYYDYYTANGWTQGRSSKPIKDWKATARNWVRNEKKFKNENRNGFEQSNFDSQTLHDYVTRG